MGIFVIVSQDTGSVTYAIHRYTTSEIEAKKYLDSLAFEDLKTKLGKPIHEKMECPLADSTSVEQLSAGLITIRRNKENDRKIDMYKIEKEYAYGLYPKKVYPIIKTFEILEIEPICEANSIISDPSGVEFVDE